MWEVDKCPDINTTNPGDRCLSQECLVCRSDMFDTFWQGSSGRLVGGFLAGEIGRARREWLKMGLAGYLWVLHGVWGVAGRVGS